MDKKQDLEKIESIKLTQAEKNKAQLKAYVDKATVLKAKPVTKKGTVMVRSLRIRKDHNTDSEMVGGLVEGNEVTILETFVDGDDTWVRIGEEQWAAMIYNGETYIKVEE